MLETKRAKNFTMSMREAKDLHGDITKLLLVLQTLQTPKEEEDENEVQMVEISGGDFLNK